MLINELKNADGEVGKFNAFAQLLITEFAHMRTKINEDMDFLRKRFPMAATTLQTKMWAPPPPDLAPPPASQHHLTLSSSRPRQAGGAAGAPHGVLGSEQAQVAQLAQQEQAGEGAGAGGGVARGPRARRGAADD